LEPGEGPPTTTQLERWRQDGYIPPTIRHGRGRGPGMGSRYPEGAAEDVVSFMRLLRLKHRRATVVFPQFISGHWMSADLLRPVFLSAYGEIRREFERQARNCGAMDRGRLDAEIIAAGVAHGMRLEWESGSGRVRAFDPYADRLRDAMTQTADEDPGELLETVLTHVLYVFLSGSFLPFSGEVRTQMTAASGFAELCAALAALTGLSWIRALPQGFAQALIPLSLPALRRSVRRMDTAAFLEARDDYLRLRHALAPLPDLLAWLGMDIGQLFAFREKSLGPLGLAVFLPAVSSVRREAGKAQMSEWLAIAGETLRQMEEFQAFLRSPEGQQVDQDALRRDVLARFRAEIGGISATEH